jgi:cytochrome P450
MDGWRQCGDVVRFPLVGPLELYLCAHPDQVRRVLVDNQQNYRKDPGHSAQLKALAGDGLTMSEGDLWLRQRRMMQPAFHRQRFSDYIDSITQATQAMLASWEARDEGARPLDISTEMLRVSFDIVARTMFSANLRAEADAVVRDSAIVLEHAYNGMRTPVPVPVWLPLPSNRRFLAARRTLDELATRLIAERRESLNGRDDLLSMMLLRGGDERLAHDEIITTILAGHDTTGVALAWTFSLLSTHPEVARRLHLEVAQVLDGRPPTLDDLPALEYAEMVLKESLRLFPPAWVLSRRAVDDDEIAGFHIPRGATIFVSPYLTHRHPGFWRNPEAFDPERFRRGAAPPAPFAYFPFGGGPRLCIGNNFALMAAQIVLVLVVQSYRLELHVGQSVVPRAKLTLHPRRKIFMTLESIEARTGMVGDSGGIGV